MTVSLNLSCAAHNKHRNPPYFTIRNTVFTASSSISPLAGSLGSSFDPFRSMRWRVIFREDYSVSVLAGKVT